MMNVEEILAILRSQANPDNVAGMARFGINPSNTLGISIPVLRGLARQIGHDHGLAQELWASGVHEARILAALVDNPRQVDEAQMEAWVLDFDSWDVCDQVCSNLFDRTPFAWEKAHAWSVRPEEFVRRAGFVLMAALATHDKKASDAQFVALFPLMQAAASDERNFVRKAVNWALRGVGKRNRSLNTLAIKAAQDIQALNNKTARWIAGDALRELTSEKVQAKLDKSLRQRP
jgi:3-methyladenine DNA glycosylase AlkD